jgi:hypothetical protein
MGRRVRGRRGEGKWFWEGERDFVWLESILRWSLSKPGLHMPRQGLRAWSLPWICRQLCEEAIVVLVVSMAVVPVFPQASGHEDSMLRLDCDVAIVEERMNFFGGLRRGLVGDELGRVPPGMSVALLGTSREGFVVDVEQPRSLMELPTCNRTGHVTGVSAVAQEDFTFLRGTKERPPII